MGLAMTAHERRPWRAIRAHMGWTQEEAARQARVTLSTYRRWETGRGAEGPAADPGWALLCMIAKLPEDWQPAAGTPDESPST